MSTVVLVHQVEKRLGSSVDSCLYALSYRLQTGNLKTNNNERPEKKKKEEKQKQR